MPGQSGRGPGRQPPAGIGSVMWSASNAGPHHQAGAGDRCHRQDGQDEESARTNRAAPRRPPISPHDLVPPMPMTGRSTRSNCSGPNQAGPAANGPRSAPPLHTDLPFGSLAKV